MLNGSSEPEKSDHLATWQSVKAVSCSTEEEAMAHHPTRERILTNELTLVFANGRTAILK